MITIQNDIKNTINKALKDLYPEENISFSVEAQKNPDFGDYSSNVLFAVSKKTKKSFLDVAGALMEHEAFEKIKLAFDARPEQGFLNFYLKEDYLAEKLLSFGAEIRKNKKQPIVDTGLGKSVNVEFLSSNPTGEPHIGNARSAFFGDVLAGVYEACGYKTTREFYINDSKSGGQIMELGKTILGQANTYSSAYVDSIAKKIKKTAVFKRLLKEKDSEKKYSEVGYFMAKEIMKDIKKLTEKKLKIKFDVWFSEQKMREKKEIEKIIDFLSKKGYTYKKEGALWLKTSQFEDDEDRVLVRTNGEPTYFASDIAYHKDKMERKDKDGPKYDIIVDIWGADHHGHKKRMEVAMRMLGFEGEFKMLISQLVAIKKDGKTARLSKREGTVITISDLLDEIPLDVVKIFYLTKSLDTHLDFDIGLALEQSSKNPVYYVQYAYVRILGILKKAKTIPNRAEFKNLNKKERNLMTETLRFPEALLHAVGKDDPHTLFLYAYSLAGKFQSFYDECRIIGEREDVQNRRVYLILCAKNVFERLFNIFGVSAPKKM